MVQGGGFDSSSFVPAPDVLAPIVNEAKFGLSNTFGTIAMARTDDPNRYNQLELIT